jgi:hypothetical protein
MKNCLCTFSLIFLSGCAGLGPEQRVPVHAHPSPFTPGSRPYRFDCDSEAGRYSEVNVAISGNNLWVTGFMQVVMTRPDPKWPPDAGVVFAGPSKLPRVGLETFILPDNPAVLQFAVRGTGGPADHTVFASAPLSEARLRFTLKVSDSGELSLAVGDAKTALQIGSVEMTRVNLYCSSIHVHFSDVISSSGKNSGT